MKITVPPSVRVALYVLTLLGAPVVVYLRARGIIGDLELTLWGAEVSAVSALAAFNVPSSNSGLVNEPAPATDAPASPVTLSASPGTKLTAVKKTAAKKPAPPKPGD